MEIKLLGRSLLHRTKSNKITVIAGIFVTVFLWQTMTTGKDISEDAFDENPELKQENSKSRFSLTEVRHRELEREKEVKIDIRGINSKLEKINKINSATKDTSQLYSLTNIDPDIEKGEKAQALVGHAFDMLDNFIDTNSSTTYKGMKAMFSMWNPKSSKVTKIIPRFKSLHCTKCIKM